MSDDTLRFVDETKQTQDTYSYLKPIGIRKLRKQINTKEFKKNYFVIDTRKEQPLVVHYDPNHVKTPQSAGGSTNSCPCSNSSTSSAPFTNNNQNHIQHHDYLTFPSSSNKQLSHPIGQGKRVQFSHRNSISQPYPATHQQFMMSGLANTEQTNSQIIGPPYGSREVNHLNSRRTLSMPEFLAHYSPPTPLENCDDLNDGQLFDEHTQNEPHPLDQECFMQPGSNENSSPIYRKSSIDCQFTPIDQHQILDGYVPFLTPQSTMSPEDEQMAQHNSQVEFQSHQQQQQHPIHHQLLLNKHLSMNDIGKLSLLNELVENNRLYYTHNDSTVNILETLQMAYNSQHQNAALLLNSSMMQQVDSTGGGMNEQEVANDSMQQSDEETSHGRSDSEVVSERYSPTERMDNNQQVAQNVDVVEEEQYSDLLIEDNELFENNIFSEYLNDYEEQ